MEAMRTLTPFLMAWMIGVPSSAPSLTPAIVLAGVQPQLAAVGDSVFVVFGQGDTISVARSTDGGETFRPAVALPAAGRLSLGMRRGPRIAGTTQALLVSAVAGTKGGGADGDVVLYRSTDGGGTWTTPVAINDEAGSAREGLHAMASTPAGLVVLAWLDLRQGGTRIYATVSRDHGRTWASDALVYASPDGAVCECCHPSIAIGANGQIAVMFRNNLGGNRDMYVARSSDAVTFAPPAKLGTGSWALNACPMDGGAITFDREDIVAIWRRENQVYLSTSAVPEQLVGPGRDPVVSQFEDRRDLAWSAPEGVRLSRGDSAPVSLGPGRFPSVLALADRTVVAWEHQGQAMVTTLRRGAR
jgi:hypothetical protein